MGFQEGSGAGVRVVLGYVKKRFPSRAYGSVPDGVRKGLRNLTTCLTPHLPDRLTGYLTVGLTKSRVRAFSVGAKVVRKPG